MLFISRFSLTNDYGRANWLQYIFYLIATILWPLLCFSYFIIKDRFLFSRKKGNYIVATFLALYYVFLFFKISDFSPEGIFNFVKYLIFIAASEELIFRGIIYNEIKKYYKNMIAIIISGLFFGGMHALIPIIKMNPNLFSSLGLISNEMLNGIISNALFCFLYEYGNTIFIPILIHAILDFSKSTYELLILIIISVYLFWTKKKVKQK